MIMCFATPARNSRTPSSTRSRCSGDDVPFGRTRRPQNDQRIEAPQRRIRRRNRAVVRNLNRADNRNLQNPTYLHAPSSSKILTTHEALIPSCRNFSRSAHFFSPQLSSRRHPPLNKQKSPPGPTPAPPHISKSRLHPTSTDHLASSINPSASSPARPTSAAPSSP